MDENYHPIYKPIQHDQVRLIKFSHDGNRTSAVFEAFSLDGPIPPYLTLSYTWGVQHHAPGAVPSHFLHVGTVKIRALAALESFLQILATKNTELQDTWWWIDSICINLEDMEERSQQVQLMGEIYRHAQKVIIWLGEESDDTDRAFDFMHLLYKTLSELHQQIVPDPTTAILVEDNPVLVERIRRVFQQDYYQEHWDALTNLCSRRWWSRVWTLQEYAIPKNASFWCGRRTISRLAVEGALKCADQCMPDEFKNGDPRFCRSWNRKRVHQWVQMMRSAQEARASMSLLALAAYSSCFEAMDARDRLYGLKGLATNTYSLHADYTLGVEETYLQFAKGFIEYHKSLDIICFAAIHCPLPESTMPSWVPDWRATRPSPLPVPSMVSQSAKSHVGNLGDFRLVTQVKNKTGNGVVCYAACKDLHAVYAFSGSKLVARGIIVDVVDGLAGSQNEELVQSSRSQTDPVTMASGCLPVTVPEILHSVCRSLVLGRQDRYLLFAAPLDEYFHVFAWLCAQMVQDLPSSVIPEEFRQWFDRTRQLRIQGYSFEKILKDSNEVTNIGSSSPDPVLDESILDTFLNRFFDTIVRMFFRLMITGKGRIGLASEKASKGDLVCVLFGCSVPVLLRQCQNRDGEDVFMFVGECFLDGIMEGQGLDDPACSMRDFCIE